MTDFFTPSVYTNNVVLGYAAEFHCCGDLIRQRREKELEFFRGLGAKAVSIVNSIW